MPSSRRGMRSPRSIRSRRVPPAAQYACDTCQQPTQYGGTRRCDNCWEVEHRLADYLAAAPGRAAVRAALAAADAAAAAL